MNKRSFCITLSACLCWVLLGGSVRGQVYVTKSGTEVTPTPRLPASIDTHPKSALTATDPTAGTFIVVVPDDLAEAVKPLLQWKRQQGFRVETMCCSILHRDTIRLLLQQRYDNATFLLPAQRYVLLVGDVDRLQAFVGAHTPSGLNSHVTDLYYAEYTGDYLPEAQVGRLSVADSAQLAHVVEKLIAYEQGQWAFDTTQALLTAGRETNSLALQVTNGQVDYLSRLTAANRPWLDTVCFYNPTSESQYDHVTQALGQPNAMVSYTAHCTRSGWHLPTVTFHTIDSLDNPVPTLFFNNCCLSNAFDGLCFGEELLRRASGGAVGVIGASNETLWIEDYYWAVGAKYPIETHPPYDSLLPGAFDLLITQPESQTLGEMMQAGCRAVTQGGSPFDAFYWETYNLLGDPSMTPFLGHPGRLTLTMGDTLTAGIGHLTLHSTPGARVTVTQDTFLMGTAVANPQGVAQIALTRALQGDSVTLTASQPGHIPTSIICPLRAPSEGKLAVTNYHTDNGQLHVTVRNVGSTAASNHHIEWRQDSTDRQSGYIMGNFRTDTLSLSAGKDTLLHFPTETLVVGRLPIFCVHLQTSDSNGHAYDTLALAIDLPNPQPRLLSIHLLGPDSTSILALEPESNYMMHLVLDRPTDSATLAVNGTTSSLVSQPDSILWLPFTTPDTTVYALQIILYKAGQPYPTERWVTAYRALERFETGTLDNYPWHTDGLYPWQVDSTFANTGQISLRSGDVSDNQRSSLILETEVLSDDSISFYYNVSSEANDWLLFYIDNRKYGFWSGNSGWRRFACPIRQGHHRLQWYYQKDASKTERSDCAWIDDVQLPLCIWDAPYGMAQTDSTSLAIPETPGMATGLSLLNIRPNPSRGTVSIATIPAGYSRQIMVFDAMGRNIDKIILPSDTPSTQYNTHHLRLGIYYLVMHDVCGTHIQKMIVTR